MGRSQETVGKKEKEKKKKEKRKEKLERAEERKANSSKGKALDDMLAYLDENGNLTSTPPDPFKKKEIDLEDIQLGAAKVSNEPDAPHTGIVKFFNEAKGYGFIDDVDTKKSVFVHINQLTVPIKERDRVTFDIEQGPKGPSATNVKKI